MSYTAQAPLIADLHAQRPLPRMATIALRLAVVLAKWSERARSRKALGQLDARLLRDVGLERRAAQREAHRMFWRG